jgi:hypothetical protein
MRGGGSAFLAILCAWLFAACAGKSVSSPDDGEAGEDGSGGSIASGGKGGMPGSGGLGGSTGGTIDSGGRGGSNGGVVGAVGGRGATGGEAGDPGGRGGIGGEAGAGDGGLGGIAGSAIGGAGSGGAGYGGTGFGGAGYSGAGFGGAGFGGAGFGGFGGVSGIGGFGGGGFGGGGFGGFGGAAGVGGFAGTGGFVGEFVITFDELAGGTVVTNQYDGVTFSTNAGSELRSYAAGNFENSQPNMICVFTGGSVTCQGDVFVDFSPPVRGIRFLALGTNDSGVIARVDLYQGMQLIVSYNLLGAGNALSTPVDLSSFSNVSRMEIIYIYDGGGIGWDDFHFVR